MLFGILEISNTSIYLNAGFTVTSNNLKNRISVMSSDWHFVNNLGSGGFGVVQLWENKRTKKQVAVKICKEDNADLTPTQKERWVVEVEKMKHLQHPNIVKIENIPDDVFRGHSYLPALCMEYCRKGDLRKTLNKIENCCGMSERNALQAIQDISSAVEFLHSQNITHRDLKPENIVLQDLNGKTVYKLIDLGYAKDLGEASIYASIVGTLNYVAPELLWDKKYSCSVDYWSLGILFYEIVTGQRPFLPKMQHTLIWIKHIQGKSDDEICAHEIHGKIVFGTDIEGPTDLSICVKSKLTEWFKVALQFDPKKRGKHPKGMCNGTNNKLEKPKVIIFELIRSILSKKVLYIFSLSLYKIFAYEVDELTLLPNLQEKIEQDMSIPVKQQVITDYYGKMVASNEKLFNLQTVDPCCFIFEFGKLSIGNQLSADLRSAVQGLISHTCNKTDLDYFKVKDYYRSIIFLLQKEIELFKLYTFAVSIKIDLLNMRIENFKQNMQQGLLEKKLLVQKVTEMENYVNHQSLRSEDRKNFESLLPKTETLCNAADTMEKNFNDILQRNDKLKNNVLSIDGISKLSELYDDAVIIFTEFLNNAKHQRRIIPRKMVQVVTKFLNVQRSIVFSANVTSQSNDLEHDISKLEHIFKSVVALTPIYRQKLLNVALKDNGTEHLNVNEVRSLFSHSESDCVMKNNTNIIYDNLVIHHTFESLMTEVQKKCLEILSLDL